MKTTDIKGKSYVEVHERIKYLRAHFKGYSLLSELVKLENGVCVFKAILLNEKREEVANGFAYEKENSSFINKTSYIENCETSAWGRCLGNFGIGIDTSVASADEVKNAIKQREDKPAPKKQQKENVKEEKKDIKSDNFRSQVLHLTGKEKQKLAIVLELLKVLRVDELEQVLDKVAFLNVLEKKVKALDEDNNAKKMEGK